MDKVSRKLLYWTPRILSVLFLLFITLFSLDVFSMKLSFWQTILALFMHNIPSLILLIIVIAAWKYDLVGIICFALAGFAYIIILVLSPNFEWYMLFWTVTISGPAFLTAAFYYVNWKHKNE